jgi:hypothetical protein
MAGEQSHLTRHHAEFGAARAAPRGRINFAALVALLDVLRRAMKVEVNLFATGILKDQYRSV